MTRPQVRLDDDVAAALEARRDDRSLAQEANRLLRQALGLDRAQPSTSEQRGPSSVKAPTGELPRVIPRANAGWQGRSW